MKLVDILARELKVWPESADSLAQSFGGMVFYISSVVQLKTLFRTEVSEDWREAMVFKPQWQAAVDALKDEKVVAWNGEGLPPVGICIELRHRFEKPAGEFFRATVVAVGKKLFIASYGEGEVAAHIDSYEFRPIRTPEQIAKQERSKACDKMYGVILDKIPQDRRNNGSDICEALYDAGYRKFEIVDN